ncbi:MAG TPA: DNA polymerase [Puia sp.]|jgi:DNA polymerase I-like protein with 3'-5' exonuclease and polymerase domains
MIYLITQQAELFKDNLVYEKSTVTALIQYLKSVLETCLDTETNGFDPHTKELLSLQIGDATNQYVIDCKTVDISVLKPYLENILIVGQNLKFDLKFLFKKGIYLRKIWDTMVVEKVLYCGLPEIRVGLDSITERYLGFKLDKSVRAEIQKEGLTSRVIKYGADDIKFLPAIKEKQIEALIAKELKGTVNLENRFTPCLAYIEYCGFKLDRDKWLAKMEKDALKLKQAQEVLNQWIMNKGLVKYFTQQISLFDPVSCKINWSSSKQVIELFEELGINCRVVEKGVAKKSVEAGNIEKQKGRFPFIGLYLEYKKAEKVVSTYGENFLKQINPVTGRVHSNFKQIMDTGRLSSGGKDKITKEEYINFQNIPKDPETRGCFVAEPGNVLIISDYSGQEQVVLANFSMDRNLLKFYDEGLGDMHAFVASKMYPQLDGLTLDIIKSQYKEERQEAKITGFTINYGGVGQTIADQLGKAKEDGERIYNAYFVAFPGLRAHFDKVKKQGLRDGYILISTLTKRKSYLPFFKEFKELEAEMDSDFWEIYRSAKENGTPDLPRLKEKVSRYFMYKGDVERKSLNFPIQGSSAEITKVSCVHIFDYIIDNGLFDIVKFVNTIHDENVLEAPIDQGELISQMVKKAMFKAGQLHCKRVPLKAEPELSYYWKK